MFYLAGLFCLIFWQTPYSLGISTTCLRKFPQIFYIKTSSQKYSNFEVSFCSEEIVILSEQVRRKVYLTGCDELKLPQWIQLTCPKRNDKDIFKFEFLAPKTEVGRHCIKIFLLPIIGIMKSPSCIISLDSMINFSTIDYQDNRFSFSIDIEIQPDEPIEKLMNNLACDNTKIRTVASVYVDVDFDALNMSSQLMLLKKFSTFLGISTTSLSIKTITDFPDIDSVNVIRSGSGHRRQISNGKMTSLEWIIGCGSVHSSFEPPLKLLDKTALDILGNNIGWNLIFWRVINNISNLQPHSLGIYKIISEPFQNTLYSPMNYLNSSIVSSQDITGVESEIDIHMNLIHDYQKLSTSSKYFGNERNKDQQSVSHFVTDESNSKILDLENSPKDDIIIFTQIIDVTNINITENSKKIAKDISDSSEYQMLSINENVLESDKKMESEIYFYNEELDGDGKEGTSKHYSDIQRESQSKKKKLTKQYKYIGTKTNKLLSPLSISVGSVLEFNLPIFKTNDTKQNIDLLFLTSTDSEQYRRHSNDFLKTFSKSKELKNQPFETIGVPPNSWIKLNQTTLYGLALEEHIGKYRYIIALVNKRVLSKYDLEIEVISQHISQIVSHEFEITIQNVNYSRIIQDVFLRIDLVKKISSAFHDENFKNILITGILPGSIRIVWTNSSLPTKPCSYEQLKSLMKFIFKDGLDFKKLSEDFINVFRPHLISSARFIPKNSCKGFFSVSERMISTDEIKMDPMTSNEENVTTLLYIMIPMVVVAALLLIILLTCICCYIFGNSNRTCEANKMSWRKTITKIGSGNSVPIIFADELKSPISVCHIKPVLADQLCTRTPPPTYTHSINIMESNISTTVRCHLLPTPLECSFGRNYNDP